MIDLRRCADVLIGYALLGGRADVHGRTFRRQVHKFGVREMSIWADSWRIPYYTSSDRTLP